VKQALAAGLMVIAFVAGCSPEVGSERWCRTMEDKPKGDWTLSETRDYARYCMLEMEREK